MCPVPMVLGLGVSKQVGAGGGLWGGLPEPDRGGMDLSVADVRMVGRVPVHVNVKSSRTFLGSWGELGLGAWGWVEGCWAADSSMKE